ncbi:MAG: penicillin amidase, partial [Alphaproteobacteria bacterium]
MSAIKQKLIKASAIIVIIVSALVFATYLALKTSLPDYDQKLSLTELDKDVEIIRDQNAIPHIFAANLADAYFGLGFAHAQDRLWQLELTRAASNGRLSEIFGAATLPVDKLTRTVDSAKVARLSLERMTDETKQHFQRYVDGINSYITHRSGLLPPEFLLFSVEPTPWTLEDTAKIFALVGLGADNWQQELKRAAMQQHLSDAQIDTLFPAYPTDGPVTHSEYNAPSPKTGQAQSQVSLLELPYLKELTELTDHPLIAGYPASNTWVIDGSLTKSGKPLLASDPHGPIKAPADYYLAHLSGPTFDITGVGYVGMPVFAIGHNR